MTDTTRRFLSAIDRDCEAESSVAVRYRRTLTFEADRERDERYKALLCEGSIREGLRIVPYLRYRDVEVHVLDETSLMATNTLKSIDGCVSSAKCVLDGHRRVVFESGANTGTALTVYGHKAGLETFCFVPEENLPLLDSKAFLPDTAHLVSVSDPSLLKTRAAEFARDNGLVHIPKPQWRYEASMLIGGYLLEQFLDGPRYDVIVQSISAAFAPIGIYRVLRAHRESLMELPRFIGIQQAANCPMAKAWHRQSGNGDQEGVHSTAELISKVMYDSNSHTYGTFDEFHDILEDVGGDVDVIGREEFDAALAGSFGHGVLATLSAAGVEIGMRDGEVIEKTGVMALAGAIKQIDAGRIAAGSRILVCLTGGAGVRDGMAVPTLRLDGEQAVADPAQPRRGAA